MSHVTVGEILKKTKSSRGEKSKPSGKLVMLACSEPPEGAARWTLRLLADKMVELHYVDSMSHVTVGEILKKTKSSRGE
jgi:hypothetical protein